MERKEYINFVITTDIQSHAKEISRTFKSMKFRTYNYEIFSSISSTVSSTVIYIFVFSENELGISLYFKKGGEKSPYDSMKKLDFIEDKKEILWRLKEYYEDELIIPTDTVIKCSESQLTMLSQISSMIFNLWKTKNRNGWDELEKSIVEIYNQKFYEYKHTELLNFLKSILNKYRKGEYIGDREHEWVKWKSRNGINRSEFLKRMDKNSAETKFVQDSLWEGKLNKLYKEFEKAYVMDEGDSK